MAYPYYPNYYNSPFLQMPSMQTQAAAQGGRNSDFVLVRSEDEARNYPVAFGNTVTFKDENTPFIYTKTMGNSQLDQPIFERYRLVKETAQDAPQDAEKAKDVTGDVEKLRSEIEAVWREIEAMKKKTNSKRVTENECV